MNDVEQLRGEIQDLRASVQTVLALTLHAIGQAGDAKPLLASITVNLAAATHGRPDNPTLDAMASALLLPLSSLALKQHPNDPEVLSWYRELRPGERH